MLGVSDLMMYDILVPLINLPKKTIRYDEALEIIENALQPLVKTYIKRMKAGLRTDGSTYMKMRENKRRYSFGSYSSKPFILCNYNDTLEDVHSDP